MSMTALKNDLQVLHPSGKVGKILAANEKNWIHPLLTDNPGLFSGFADPDDPAIFKTMWHGEFPGKLLTGIAQTYLLHNDSETRKIGDQMVSALRDAQEESGYLGPWPKNVRFNRDVPDPMQADPIGKWDTWGHYHCIYGLYRWYQVTGNLDALQTALKALDHIYDYFIAAGRPIASQKWAECNLAIGHAFALLYEETGCEKYLQAAEHIVLQGWPVEYWDFYSKSIRCCSWMQAALEGKAFYASGQPRWEGLYALETLSVLHRITHKEIYAKALCALWRGMEQTDRHNTGSFGTGEGAVGDVYGPWSETCNTVAWMAFSTDYLKFSGDSRVADELELSFYNAAMGSLLAGERNFTYRNDSDGQRTAARIDIGGHAYQGAPDMSCCQANGNRGLTQLTEWALLHNETGLYLNYYGASAMKTRLSDGRTVCLNIESLYPADGAVRIRLSGAEGTALPLHLRIPSWSENTVILLNGQPLESAAPGAYYAIQHAWQDGDVIELTLDMRLHYWASASEKLPGRISAYYGPLLLAVSEKDLSFTRQALEKAVQIPGQGMIDLQVQTVCGGTAHLTDYYTAGKDGAFYTSWLSCDLTPTKADPIWCAR